MQRLERIPLKLPVSLKVSLRDPSTFLGMTASRYAVALPSSGLPNSIPCANGNSVEKLIVFV